MRILHTEFSFNWTTPWSDEKELSLKLFIWNNSKFPYGKFNIFLHKLEQKFFLFETLHTLGIPHTKFGSIWTTPWPNKISIFLKIEWANNKRISRYFRLKNQLLSWASYSKNSFAFRLYTHWGDSTPSLVLLRQLLDPIRKTYF